MSELFDNTEETLSPKEEWVKKHNVTCTVRALNGGGDEWVAAFGYQQATSTEGRDDALRRLAQRLWLTSEGRIKPWGM